MAGFDDLIAAALPFLATETIRATEGTTWQWDYELRDNANALVDISTGFTLAAAIYDQQGVLLVTPTVSTPSTGVLRCKVTAAASAALAEGFHRHEVTIARTSDSAKLVVVGSGESQFVVLRGVT